MSLGKTAINASMTSASEFWGGANSYSLLFGRAAPENEISRALGRQGGRALKAAVLALVGSAAGTTAVGTYTRITAPNGLANAADLGGLRTTEVIADINRATDSTDEVYVEGVMSRIADMAPAIASYPTDASGNGGGGKVGV